MKVVILAGGKGMRLREETETRPKPMVEIGGMPILWHIMKIYAHHGLNEFIVCLGYKGYIIKEYFSNYLLHRTDVTVDLASNSLEFHGNQAEPWKITLINTGEETLTGERIKRAIAHVNDEPFCMTYGDGVSNVDITAGVKLFKKKGKKALVTAVQMPGRFGVLDIEADHVVGFREKPQDGGWINGGFFVLSPDVANLIEGDQISWERGPLEKLAEDGQLIVNRHSGFWLPMDTMRDKLTLEAMWESGKAPWKVW